jgi:hypothetical protein
VGGIGQTIGSLIPGGNVGKGIGGALFDPANISGAFGNNTGPGAFMDPGGSGGGLFPGQSLGTTGSLGINPEGAAGINPSSANKIGSIMNAIGGIFAGGSTLGGSGFMAGDTGAVGSGTAALPAATDASSIGMASPAAGTASSGGSGIMSMMNSPLGNTLLNQAGGFANSAMNKPGAAPPAQAGQRAPTIVPVQPVGPKAGAEANPAATLASYASMIRNLKMAA